jgi:hypothetical protein
MSRFFIAHEVCPGQMVNSSDMSLLSARDASTSLPAIGRRARHVILWFHVTVIIPGASVIDQNGYLS